MVVGAAEDANYHGDDDEFVEEVVGVYYLASAGMLGLEGKGGEGDKGRGDRVRSGLVSM